MVLGGPQISNPPENYQGAPKKFFFAVSASTGINLQIHQRFSKSESGPAENAIFWYHLTWNAPVDKFFENWQNFQNNELF